MKKRVIKEELKKREFRVTIFGSARIKEGDTRYNMVERLARMLGERGIDVVTGGGPGLMKAAAQGLQEGVKKGKKEAHSIGLGISLPKEQGMNKHLDIKKEFKRFSRRLDNFMLLSNAVVVAPGGVGTLLELFYTWQLAQVDHICHIPIILLGKEWPSLVEWLEKEPLRKGFLSREDLNLLFLANNCQEAIKVIEHTKKEFDKGNKDFCLNYKKYKIE